MPLSSPIPFFQQATQQISDRQPSIFSFEHIGSASDREVCLVVLLLVYYSMTMQNAHGEMEELVARTIYECSELAEEQRYSPAELGPWSPPDSKNWSRNVQTVRDVLDSIVNRTADQLVEPVLRAFVGVTGCATTRSTICKWKYSLVAGRKRNSLLAQSLKPRTHITRLSHMMPAVAFCFRRDKDEYMKLLEQKIDACETEKSLLHDAPTASPQKATLKRLLLEKNEAVAILEMQVEDREEIIAGLEVCFKCVHYKFMKNII
jgi:hypothetical protein